MPHTAAQPFRKWLVLGIFGFAAGLTQLLWLNFAPILSLIEKQYSVTESQASLLLLVFPAAYVLLSVHAGAVTDRRGYRTALVFGTAVMALFATVRIFQGSFWLLLGAQVGIAVAQPYVVNAISKLVLDWFEKKHEALATGLGTMGMFVGMAVGLAATPPLVEAWGLQGTMLLFAAGAIAVLVATLVFIRPNPANVGTADAATPDFRRDFKVLIKNRDLRFLLFLAFLGLGYFNGLTTWLEPILAPQGFDSNQAGIVGGVLIGGGVLGSVLIPGLSDYFRRRKPFLIVCVLVSLLTVYPFASTTSWQGLLGLGVVQGFFFLPAYALLLAMSAEVVEVSLVGSATGLLMLAGNLGGVVVIIAMEAIKGDAPTFTRAIYLLIALLAVAVAGAMMMRETLAKAIKT